jgi:hypothetical protein
MLRISTNTYSSDWADEEKFEAAAIQILKERLRETPVLV